MQRAFFNGRFFTGHELIDDRVLITSDDRIEGFVDRGAVPAGAVRIDCQGRLVIAGLIDLQIAGGGGFLFSSNTTSGALGKITAAIVATGTTGFLMALPTNTRDVYRSAFRAAGAFTHPALLGLHLEGPFISYEKRGAHVPELIIRPTPAIVNELLAEAQGTITMMTVAPEQCSREVIRLLTAAGITLAAGHSNATCSQAMEGYEAGIATTTHLFNAMSPFHHRDPGLPGAAFLSERACASIIADGIHTDFAAVAVAKEIMKERLFLVSDAVEENSSGAYQHVKQGDRFTLPDGTLSGARLTLLEDVKKCADHAGIDRYEAIRMATLYPARLIGAAGRGVIAPGARADMVMVDEELNLKEVVFSGKVIPPGGNNGTAGN